MNIQDYKIIIVLFPSRLGGNHFANILSTSPYIEKKIKVENYEQYLDNYYSTNMPDAHIFSDISNVGVHDLDNTYNVISQSSKTYIIAGHIDEAHWVYKQKLKTLQPVGFINFHSLSWNNNIRRRFEYLNDEYYRLCHWLYSDKIIFDLFGIDQKDMLFTVNPNNLFSPDITELLNQLNLNLELDLNLNFCNKLHAKWYKKITQ